MTGKQRKEVQKKIGIKVPSWALVRYTETEEEGCLQVFTAPGIRAFEPWGAKRVEEGEPDYHGRPTTCYYYDKLKEE